MFAAKLTSHDTLKLAGGASIAIAIAVGGLKYLAYWLTGSAALYSDALESIVNLLTALATLVALQVSSRPADRRHQFGHHKAEYFSAVFEGVLIVVAALMIFREAYDALIRPRTLSEPLKGVAVNALATVLNGVWAWFLISWGRRRRSPALAADGWHLFTDVLTSLGVLVGLVLAVGTGWRILDPALAAIVGVNVLWAGWRLVRQSVSGLMDEAATAEVARHIRQIISNNAEGAIEAHELKTRIAGRVTFIEFHLVVPGKMTVASAHQICDRLEEALKEAIEGAEVVIHVEPEAEAKQTGVPVV
jgi:cation diffusion facilitator family transporter